MDVNVPRPPQGLLVLGGRGHKTQTEMEHIIGKVESDADVLKLKCTSTHLGRSESGWGGFAFRGS